MKLVKSSLNTESAAKLLSSIIKEQSESVHYNSYNFTKEIKLCMYEAFHSILEEFPNEMVNYLINLDRKEHLQYKIFQAFILNLENRLPFSFVKNKRKYEISSLLDENLCIFDGISTFHAKVENGLIRNETKELYIGARKGVYDKPFYLGKLLEVQFENSSILSQVKFYTFSKIIIEIPDCDVLVTHLRIPPHYHMGGLMYLNNIRRKILDDL